MWEHLRNIRRITPYLRPYRRLFIWLWVFTGSGAVVALFQPWPFAFIVDAIIGAKAAPGWLSWLEGRPVWFQLAFGVFLTLMMTVVQSAITVMTETVGTKLELKVVLDYRAELFAHAQQLSLTYHDSQRKGAFIYQINFHAHSAGSVITAIPPLVQAALTLVGMFFITYRLDPQLAFVATLVAPLLFYAVRYYARYVQTELYRVRNLEGESMSIIHESMSMIWIVVANARQRHEHRKFREQAEVAIESRVRLTVMQTVFSLAVSLITALGTGVVVFLGARAVMAHELTLGELLVVLAYIAAIYKPMEQISTTLGTLQETFVNLALSFDLLDTEIEVKDAPNAIALPKVTGHVVFDDVAFSYPGRPGVLDHVSFEAQPGERVAIVGPTGAGKSTLMSLLARFSDPAEGRILLDGHDLRQIRVEDLRNSLAFVLQDPVLFSGSILENIRYGRLDATDEDVVAAARAAGADEFIRRLPRGYHTNVGERGALLSGGERQRLCVARAFVRDAPILILDEPTSSIDSRTEAVILEALDRLASGRTTLIIAHRLSTVRNADRVIVIDGGRIVESGPPARLLEHGGMFAALAAAQGVHMSDDIARPDHKPTSETSARSRAATESVRPAQATAPLPRSRPKVVVLGMLTKMPVGGVVWQVVHYLLGLERLGAEVYYVEAHARTPSMFSSGSADPGSVRAAEFLGSILASIGMSDRWAYHALHDDGAVYGMDASALSRLYREAALIINLHGGTQPRPEHAATGRLVYLETDPGQLAVELSEGKRETLDFLDAHMAFFTFAENWGAPDCLLPVTGRYQFVPTRQPVLIDLWQNRGQKHNGRFTTIGNWRQPWRPFELNGEMYHWSKHLEFERFLDLPSRVAVPLELALASIDDTERNMLIGRGWHVRHALDVSSHPLLYQEYIANSIGEFTVAKDQNVRLRSGWFSDRSCSYLAAGRPVVTQDTGFGAVLPVGSGLFACSDATEAAAAIEAIMADPKTHQRDAAAIAQEFFDHRVVLRPLLEACDASIRTGKSGAVEKPAPRPEPLPRDLVLLPVSRRPLRLEPATAETLRRRGRPSTEPVSGTGSRRVSIVVVTFENLVLTKLCLESVLANTAHPNFEVIVVDNASTDGTRSYLRSIDGPNGVVRVIFNDHNVGFAAAVNQGLAQASGEVLVIMNNDVVVAPGWLHGLAGHLDRPGIGMVGPVTNNAPNEARIATNYSTYGGFLDAAALRARACAGQWAEVGVLTMFCVMMRRSTYRTVGPLDERFGIGLFEDDDYAMRLRANGMRLACAEGVLVHHIGEAAFGSLVPTGAYGELFRRNRALYESMWGPWKPHQHRRDAAHDELVSHVRRSLATTILPGETVAVAAKGEPAWLELDGRHALQFPVGEDGQFDGSYPADDAAAIAALAELRARGATAIAFPSTSRWWLDHYTGLHDHLNAEYEVVADDEFCVVYRVREGALVCN